MKRLCLLFVLPALALSQPQPVLPPFDSEPILIDTSLVPMPMYETQTTPRAAFDGTNYLVVWAGTWYESYVGIVATRLSPDGVILDPGGIPFFDGDGAEPAVAFDGTNYLVVWSRDSTIRYARVNRAGVLLDTALVLTNVPGASPAVAFDGTNYLIAWGGNDLYAARVTPAGTVLDTEGILVSGASDVQEFPAIAFDGSNFLIVWQDMRPGGYLDVYGCRVTPAGAVLDPAGIPVSTATYSQWYPVVAFDGTNYLVAWQDYRTTDFDLYASRVTPAGTVLDPSGLPIATSAIYQRYPSLTFGNGSYFVTWERWDSAGCSGVWGARIQTSGVPRDTGFCIAPAAQKTMPVIFDGARFFTTWQQDGIRATWVDTSGNVQNPSGSPVYAIANEQRQPGAAFNGTDYLVVWQDERPGDTADIRGIRISQSGAQVDPLPFTISAAGKTQGNPAVASNGSDWLVTWSDLRNDTADIFAARVCRNGIALDTAGIPVCTVTGAQIQPAATYSGPDYLVVWQDGRGSNDIYAARVSSGGVVLDPQGFPVCADPQTRTYPNVAFDGTNCLVVWADGRAGSDIYGARVDPDGSVLDPNGFIISPDAQIAFRPAVAFGSGEYFVVWEHTGRHIDGAFVPPSGSVLDSVAPVWLRLTQRFATLAFDGSNFAVLWEDGPSGSNVYGATVSPSGARLDTFAVAATPGKEYDPKLAAGAPGQLLAVYSGWIDTAAGRPWYCRRTIGKLPPFAGVATPSFIAHHSSLTAFPTPFRSHLLISLDHSTTGPHDHFSLRIFDSQGRLIRTFPASSLLPSPSSLSWDATDSRGRPVPAGIYFVTAESGGTRQTRAVTLVRN